MSEPITLEVVLRIVNRHITEHLRWDDLLRLSRTSLKIKQLIINYCTPFEGDNLRMCFKSTEESQVWGSEYRPLLYTQALDQLAELPVAARLSIINMPPTVNCSIVDCH